MIQGKLISVRGLLCVFVCDGLDTETSIVRANQADQCVGNVFKCAGAPGLFVVSNSDIRQREHDPFVLPEYLKTAIEKGEEILIP